MQLKEKAYRGFTGLLHQKIALLQANLHDLHESARHETKSTAGDKHETALAMLQIEQENLRRQLKDAQEQLAQLENIDPLHVSTTVRKGSLIQTSHGYLYMSLGLGKIMIDETTITALSPSSPLGVQLVGCAAGAVVRVNDKEYLIEAVM